MNHIRSNRKKALNDSRCTELTGHANTDDNYVQFDANKDAHTGVKPFKCDTCGVHLARRSALKRHIRTHTGEKPYNCDKCGAQFAAKSNLKSHIRTHTGEKLFKCDKCGAQFATNGTLKSHTRTHTGEKP